MGDEDVLLDITTKRHRERIAIDGRAYELAAPQDFDLQEYMWLAAQGKRIQELGPGAYDTVKLAELTNLLDRLLRKIMRTRLPRRVMHRLSNGQKLAILDAFTKAAGTRGETARPTLRDGAKLSPASSDSTVEPSEAGSKPASAS